MTTEDMIEAFINEGIKAYKKNYRKCSTIARRLDRHESVVIDGVEFNYWKEYTVYKMAQYIKGLVPSCNLEVTLEGNNSTLQLELSDEEQRALNTQLYAFLRQIKAA